MLNISMEKSNLSEMYSVVSYTGDGALKEFSVPFPYLYREDVHVYFVSALDEEGEITREEKRLYPLIQNEYPPSVFDAYWVSDAVIKFVTAPPAGQTIEIKRITNRLVPEVEFSNSSILSEEDLNLIATQLLYIVQEAYDNQNILQSDFSEYVNETLTVTVDYAKEAKEAQEAVEALKVVIESYKEQAVASAAQAKESETNTQQAKTEAVAAIQAQQAVSESAVEQAGDAQAVRLEQLASNILVSGTAYNKEATVILDQPVATGTVVSLPVADDGQQMMYRVGASTLRMGYNGTLLFHGEQFEEVGNTGSISTRVKLLFDAEAGDVLNFFVYAQNVTVVVDEASGLSIDAQRRLSAAGVKAVADEAKDMVSALRDAFAEFERKLGEATAPGFVRAFAANSHPEGYLLCNGAAVSRTTYAALFAAIGTTYGEGDGSTTFNIPDLTDRFIQGSGTAGVLKEAGLPGINGGYTPIITSPANMIVNGAFDTTSTGSVRIATDGASTTWTSKNILLNASKSNATYGNSDTVQPPAVTMRYYIKY